MKKEKGSRAPSQKLAKIVKICSQNFTEHPVLGYFDKMRFCLYNVPPCKLEIIETFLLQNTKNVVVEIRIIL